MEIVLLAGGKSRRMGKDKLLLEQNGTTVLKAAVERFAAMFDRVYLSVDTPERYPDIAAEHIADIYHDCGPLAGLHASLKKSESGGIFLAAADIPFSSPELALKIIELANGYDICLTEDKHGRPEPLFAYYAKNVLASAEKLLENGVYKMTELYKCCKVRTVTPDELGALWDERAFENMNSPDDYERLLKK